MDGLAVAAERAGPGSVGIGASRLGSMRLHAHVDFKTRWQFRISNEIELMLLIAVGIGILLLEIIKIIVAETERIPFVGIVVQILRPDIIRIHLEPIAEALAYPDGRPAIKRSGRTCYVRHAAQVPERRRGGVGGATTEVDVGGGDQIRGGTAHVRIGEAREMHSLGDSQIKIAGPTGMNLLLITNVCCVDSRVRVILIKYCHACLERKTWSRDRRHGGCKWRSISRCRRRSSRICGIEERSRGDGLLLHSVGGNGADLCQHILPGIENPPTRTERRFAVTPDIPGESNARLKHFVLVGQSSCRRECWI